jgi:hypothetical protein
MIFIDHHKWLVESNLLTEEMKNNVAMLSYCLVEDTVDAATNIDFENKLVTYKLVLNADLYNNLKLLERYENREKLGFFEMRRLKKFLVQKSENDETGLGYKLEEIANRFIKSYLSKEWNTKVLYKSVKDYDGKKDLWLSGENNKRTD